MIPRNLLITVALLLAAIFGMGLYALHLKRTVDRTNSTGSDAKPLAPPVAGANERIKLYVAVDDEGVLHRREASIVLPTERNRRCRELLRALITTYQAQNSTHPLGAGSEINEIYFVNNNLAIVDVNAVFADGHRSGILVEELTLASLLQTLAANVPGITQMKVLVEGKERATLAGHAELTGIYDLAGISRLVKETE